MPGTNGFDKLARIYRLLEYATFGPLLWQARTAFLPAVRHARHAMVLGDGDGRFTAALLRANPDVQVVAVDASSAMLQRLQTRVAGQGDDDRLQTLCGDAIGSVPWGSFDLLCTHFFLDCLTDAEVQALVQACAARMRPDASWVLSEFATPSGAVHMPARILVRLLYAAFRALTGLRVAALPDYSSTLQSGGWVCVDVRTRLFGILRSERWSLPLEPSRASKLP